MYLIKSLLFLCSAWWLWNPAQTIQTREKDYELRIEKGSLVSVDTFPTWNGTTDTFYIWEVPVTLTNNTSDTLKYLSMVCSWDEFYITDNDKLNSWTICNDNFPMMEVLAPGESLNRYLKLMRRENSSRVNFKVGFDLIKINSEKDAWNYNFRIKDRVKNIIWSNRITI
jgi:hypothetical protein